MADAIDIPAWIALFFGVYALSAAIGELRRPGGWAALLVHFERDIGLRFLTGIVCLGFGALIYLVSPWRPDDWLAVLVTVLGGWMALEGALLIAFGDVFLAIARRLAGAANKLWAWLSFFIGVGLIAAALIRL
ncbi:MAG: hypothetical protein AB3N06_02855 [Erythrobacter sp.]